MKEQYKKANDAIHAEQELKRRGARGERSRRPLWPAAVVAAVLALACIGILWPRGGGTADDPGTDCDHSTAEPEAAQTEPVGESAGAVTLSAVYEPDYAEQYDGEALDEDYLAAIRRFAADAGKALLDPSATTAYSPATLYTALSMVCEMADGESLSALLSALGAESTDALRQYSGGLWRYLCANPDTTEPGKVTMANSLWLNGEYLFRGETLQNLADFYYTLGYVGDMQDEIPAKVSAWVREQTGGLLDCQIEPDENTMAVLLSAIYFYDEWAEKFGEVSSGRFHVGEDALVSCNYMERTEADRAYFNGNGVTASVQYFQNGGKMLFILPDEDRTPADVLEDADLLASLLDWEGLDKRTATVEWRIPRFTLSDTIDLSAGLSALGLGDLFDPSNNALPLLSGDGTPAYISEAQQGTAISIDENGCEAASYVAIMMDVSAAEPLEETVRMNLNRPFVFAILSDNDVPLFLGVVSDPGAQES